MLGLVTAVLTAFYMTRQVIMVFFGEARWETHAERARRPRRVQAARVPGSMLFPLVVLAGLSLVGGLIQPAVQPTSTTLEHWLEPVVEAGERHIDEHAPTTTRAAGALAIACALAGIVARLAIYAKPGKPIEPEILAKRWKYDQAVSAFMGGPGRKVFEAVAWFDKNIVDGAVNGAGELVAATAGVIREAQTGNVRNYAGISASVSCCCWRGS